MASQVNHFKEFATQADYEAYIQPDDYAKPLVALIDATGTVEFPQGGGGGGGGGNPILTSMDVSDFTGTTFNACTSYITDVTIPSGVTALGNTAFSGCTSLTSMTIPSGVTSIGQYAFYNSSLVNIDIPSSVTSLSQYAFNRCLRLTTVNGFGDIGITQIPNYCFLNCPSLASITLPSTVTKINNQAFDECTSLTSVTILATNPPTLPTGTQLNKVLPWYNTGFTVYVPAASVADYQAASGWSNYASKIQAIPSA